MSGENTSVGIGQVMEFYVNFGTWGTIVGFFGLGAALASADRGARRARRAGNASRFTTWYLPGLCLLQIGGSFAEVMSMAGASLVLAYILKYLTEHWTTRRPIAPSVPRVAALPHP